MGMPFNADSFIRGRRLPALLFSVLTGLIVSILLILLFSLFVWTGIFPDGLIWILGVLAAILGAYIAGFLCVRRLKVKALIFGVVTGALFFIVLYLMGAIFFARIATGIGSFVTYLLACIAAAVIGSISAASVRSRRR